MPFVKVQKTKAYFKRYQVKFRRRREGKTDYRARKRLITQDKNKYNSPKYRLVVRFSNRFVVCQIVQATLQGDVVLTQAHSKELPRYGIKCGLKNYAAAYLTGLLVARRLLNKLNMEDAYEGVTEPEGEVLTCFYEHEVHGVTKVKKRYPYYVEELDDNRKPFRCNLDVGIQVVSTGNRVLGAMKGASDGGLDIPHSEKRFPGYDREEKKYDAEAHKERIMAEHVSGYMDYLKDEDEEVYKKQFASYIEEGVESDDIEDLMTEAMEKIRADPSPSEKSTFDKSSLSADILEKITKPKKLTLEERKEKIAIKKEKILSGEWDEED